MMGDGDDLESDLGETKTKKKSSKKTSQAKKNKSKT